MSRETLKNISARLQTRYSLVRKAAQLYWGMHGKVRDTFRRFRLGSYWLFSLSAAAVSGPSLKKSKLLLVYDLASQPFSLGDYLVALQGALIRATERDCTGIDVALIYDDSLPTVTNPKAYGYNDSLDLSFLFPITFVNHKVGTVTYYNSRIQFAEQVLCHENNYYIWPDTGILCRDCMLTLHVYGEVANGYFRKFGMLPQMECKNYLNEHSRHIIDAFVKPGIPVTINVRNNRYFGGARNSSYDAWRGFLGYCAERYPVKFIIICGRNEIDDSWRTLPNVIFAKDHGTDAAQDLALIRNAVMHLGVASGPFAMATFSDKPYLMFNWYHAEEYEDLVWEENYARFAFASKLQRMFVKEQVGESAEVIIREFEKIWPFVKY